MIIHRHYSRNNRGASQTVELTAVMLLLFPLLITVIYAAIEMAQAYMISSVLGKCAEQAARQLSISYGTSNAIVSNPNSVFSQIKFLNIVTDQSQFTVPSGSNGWNTSGTLPSVTVVVTYNGGQQGRPPFPNPDPLNLGSSFALAARATSRLE